MAPLAAIDIDTPCPSWAEACPMAEGLACAAARSALERGIAASAITLYGPVELGICLADDRRQRQLNRDWRGVDRPTNVLAFPAWEPGRSVPDAVPVLLGDIVLAFETVAREAGEQGKPLADHLSHLIVHGVLHLLGYDHRIPAEAALMEALETAILESLGVADPYRDTT
jgi:probable rRNA maturation factor